MSDQGPAIGHEKMAAIHQVLERTREAVKTGSARQERTREAILHGSVPTFMELPLAREPSQLAGADAAILGFPFEGPTIVSPSRSAPPNVTRPPKGSIYWRMGADESPDVTPPREEPATPESERDRWLREQRPPHWE